MIKIVSSNIEALIDEGDGLLTSLVVNGKELCACESPIFVARLRDLDGNTHLISSLDAKNVHVSDGFIDFCGFENDFSSLCVRVIYTACEGIDWRVSVSFVPNNYALEWIELPKACLPRLRDNCPSGGSILFPYDEGILLTNETLLPRYEPEFPSSGAYFTFPNKVCSQFLAYLFDDVGLYIGAHDKKRGLKGVDFYPYNNGISLQMRLYSGTDFGSEFATDYPICWRACGGDWRSACEIYRKWLEENLPFNLTKIGQNRTLPTWYEGSPLIVTYPVRGVHDMDKMEPNALFPYTNALPILNKIKEATSTQIMALLMHWEGTAPWAPPYVWPPYGGEGLFNEFRDALHKNNDLIGVYCSGFGYTKQSTLIDSYNCEEKIEADNVLTGVCHSPQNKPELGITCTPYQRYGYDICPVSRRGKEILNEAYLPVFESGVDYAQILDQNHGGGQYLCYAREHNHPPMPGEWMTKEMQELLGEWNSKAPNMLFGCESAASEPFIGNLLMSDNRFELNYPYGTPVPVYAYLYHEYVRNFMGNQCGCPFEPTVDTLRYRIGYSFSIGDFMTLILNPNGGLMSHWGTNEFKTLPNWDLTLEFIKNMIELYNNGAKKYLHNGKMSKEFCFECESIVIPLFRGQPTISLPRLLCSSWKNENGGTAYVVINPENEPVDFSINGKIYTVSALNGMIIE